MSKSVNATQESFAGGLFLVDKPVGVTSFFMVQKIRRILGIKKVGHAGTLDPFATGLLVICAGRPATKMISLIVDGDKEYLATMRLGVETETLDPEGKVTRRRPVGRLSAEDIELCLQNFRGEQQQVPPIYSALKHKGKPLYHYARKGVEIVKPPRNIQIFALERTDGSFDLEGEEAELSIRVRCSKGTYIRTLAADIGEYLGCGAYLTDLRRTRSGCFSVQDSLGNEMLASGCDREQLLERMLSVNDMRNILQ